jgi:hypothetical protein
LGATGLELLRTLKGKSRKKPLKIIVIEKNAGNSNIQEARSLGASIIIADASDRFVLMRAGACKAAAVYAITGIDAVNYQIAISLYGIRFAYKNSCEKNAVDRNDAGMVCGTEDDKNGLYRKVISSVTAKMWKNYLGKLSGIFPGHKFPDSLLETYPREYSGFYIPLMEFYRDVINTVSDEDKKHECLDSANKITVDFFLDCIAKTDKHGHDIANKSCRCYVHISSNILLKRLGNSGFTAAMRNCLDIQLVNVYRATARHLVCEQIFGKHIPDYRENGTLRFFILGLSSLAEQIIYQLAQMAHAWNIRIRIVVLDRDIGKLNSFREASPMLAEPGEQAANTGIPEKGGYCKIQDIEIRYVNQDPLSADIDSMVMAENDLISNVYIAAMGEEAENVAAVSRIKEIVSASNARDFSRIYLRVRRTDGVSEILCGKLAPAGWKDAVAPFGITSSPLSSYFSDRRVDYLATVLHHLYLANSLAPDKKWLENDVKKIENEVHKKKTAYNMWNMLVEELRDSNRCQADHLFVKMWMLGVKLTDILSGELDENECCETRKRVQALVNSKEWKMILAETEHNRWNADKLLAGFKYGKRNDALKTHNCLVQFCRLDEADRKYDINHILEIPAILCQLSVRPE